MVPHSSTLVASVYCCLSILPYTGSSALSSTSLERRTFALEDLYPPRLEFYPEKHGVKWISESEYLLTEPGLGVKKYDASTDTDETIIDDKDLIDSGERGMSELSADRKYMLMYANKKRIYRRSSQAEYFIYDIEKKSISNLGQGYLQTVLWGNSKSLAYVQDNNVYYVPDVRQPQQSVALTTQGIPGQVYFGVTDWIYEEEVFNDQAALWFSPGGTYLAVASFNDTNVPTASFPFYGNPGDFNFQYPQTIEFKYPKAGSANPVVGLRVYNVQNPASEPVNIPAPVDVVGLDHILGRVNWASDSNLVVLWLNRRQNISLLVSCDLIKNNCRMVKERMQPNGWIDIEEPFFDATGTKMVVIQPFYNGEQRLMHVGLLDFNTSTANDITPLNGTVKKVLGWHAGTDTVYFTMHPTDTPWLRQLWSTSNGTTRCITCKEAACPNVGSTSFAPGAAYGIVSCVSTYNPERIMLLDTQKNTLKLIKDNERLRTKLKQYKLPMQLFNVIQLGDDIKANVKLLLPPDMTPGQKYPMVVRVYAGPGSSRVTNSFELDYSTYLSGNRSFIVASIDVRGSSGLGVDALYAVNNALGTVEVTDTIDAIRRLITLYDYIDEKRIGVWGWSYGGFVTTMMLIKDEPKTIACGVAVAPVTSWLYYDSIYTERYMDTPQHNPSGYKNSDVILEAGALRGRRFLLIHGTGDDNVHYQNSLALAKRLQYDDIEFEQMSYTDENHSLPSVTRHFYHTIDHFWTECFA